MAPIVKTLPSYSQHALEIVRDFNFLGQGYGYCISFYCHSPFCRSNIFFDQRTVKEPSSETRLHFQLKLSNIFPIPLPLYLP